MFFLRTNVWLYSLVKHLHAHQKQHMYKTGEQTVPERPWFFIENVKFGKIYEMCCRLKNGEDGIRTRGPAFDRSRL